MNDLQIEVAYALPAQQRLKALTVEKGVCILEAINRSGILAEFPEIDLAANKVGIFGKVVKKIEQHELKAGDRIEIYRKLIKS